MKVPGVSLKNDAASACRKAPGAKTLG